MNKSPFGDAYVGGVEIDVRNLCRDLPSRGHVVHFACLSNHAPQGVPKGVTVHHVAFPRVPLPRGARTILEARAFVRRLRSIVIDYRIDVVNAHLLYPAGMLAAEAVRGTGARLVVTLSSEEDLTAFRNPAETPRWPSEWVPVRNRSPARCNRALSEAKAVVVISPHLVQKAVAEFPAATFWTSTIRPGIDVSRFSGPPTVPGPTAAERGSRMVFGCVSRLSPPKRVDLVLRAFARLPTGLATLRIAGTGPQAPALEALAAALGIADRVEFVGLVNYDAVAPFYRGLDAFVFASDSEGFPKVVTESIAGGLHVIASDLPSTEYFRRFAGCDLRPNAVDAFAEAMAAALSLPRGHRYDRDAAALDHSATADLYSDLILRITSPHDPPHTP